LLWLAHPLGALSSFNFWMNLFSCLNEHENFNRSHGPRNRIAGHRGGCSPIILLSVYRTCVFIQAQKQDYIKMIKKLVNMDLISDIENRLTRLDKEINEIIHSIRHHKVNDKDAELKNLKDLIHKIGSHRIDEEDTTVLIREMREKQYDI
jgi:hypothetical protein